MIFLYADVLYSSGGIETYLHALALHLQHEQIPFRVAVAELTSCPLIDDLEARGIKVYRQRRVPGDRWLIRQWVLLGWLLSRLKAGDWIFCVRQPMPALYLSMVRCVHWRKARLAASWALAPEFLPPAQASFNQAIAETDAVISVSHCTSYQFKTVYGYEGAVHVVPYHNLPFFDAPLPAPAGLPWKIGFLGRLDIRQKNLDVLLRVFADLTREQADIELHFFGGGHDQAVLEQQTAKLNVADRVFFHGSYDHRRDLPTIMAACHFLVYPSRYEGGPCFSLLEMLQAGRFCVASRVGGIPDLYDGHPEAGILTDPDDPATLLAALRQALRLAEAGELDPQRIRQRYDGHFDLASAHRAWLAALSLS